MKKVTQKFKYMGKRYSLKSVPRQIWDRRFATCFVPTTFMVALHRRYLYDMDTSMDDFDAFTSHLNSIYPTIELTSNYSFTSISFVDVNVFVENGDITTDLYTKASNRNHYLLLLDSSCHPQHTKRDQELFHSASLALRRRICSSDETFKQRSILNELKSDRFIVA